MDLRSGRKQNRTLGTACRGQLGGRHRDELLLTRFQANLRPRRAIVVSRTAQRLVSWRDNPTRMSLTTQIQAPRGRQMSCRGWHQEAALRMLMNNLDPEVAENPEELIVYGGTGKAARNWECYEAIVNSLKELEDDETLLVQSGKPVGIFKTHPDAPRVLISNAMLVP